MAVNGLHVNIRLLGTMGTVNIVLAVALHAHRTGEATVAYRMAVAYLATLKVIIAQSVWCGSGAQLFPSSTIQCYIMASIDRKRPIKCHHTCLHTHFNDNCRLR